MRKGYIGPLGDDFPSIFPIALGLIIFFSALYVAYASYQMKEDYVQTMRANIMISRAVRYQIYFDKDYWDFTCDLALALKTNYAVHLVMWLEENDQGKGNQIVKWGNGWGNDAICPSPMSSSGRDLWGRSSFNSPADLSNKVSDIAKNRVITVMTYPVLVVSENKENTPARLVVVTWR